MALSGEIVIIFHFNIPTSSRNGREDLIAAMLQLQQLSCSM